MAKILVEDGTADVKVGTLVAIMVEDAKDVAAFANVSADQFKSTATPAPATPAPAPPTPAASTPAPAAPKAPTTTPSAASTDGSRVVASPLARAVC